MLGGPREETTLSQVTIPEKGDFRDDSSIQHYKVKNTGTSFKQRHRSVGFSHPPQKPFQVKTKGEL